MTQRSVAFREINSFYDRIVRELEPRRLLVNFVAGLIIGVIAVNLTISFAALIFTGDLSDYLSAGISLGLFSVVVIGVVSTLLSSFPGTISGPRSSPAAILGISGATIAGILAGKVPPQEIFLTIVAMIGLTSITTGIIFLVLGQFKMGNLIRFLPYPVVGGFLAGIGLLLVRGSIGILTGVRFSFVHIPRLLQPELLVRWLAGALFAVLLLVITRRYKHFLIMPGMLVLAVFIFYLVLWVTGMSVAEAGARGWLLGPFPEGGGWKLLTITAITEADWKSILSLAGNGATILGLSAVATLLQVTGIELAVEQDMDLNRELKVTGLANLISGLGGGLPGYPAPSMTVLGHKMGANSRVVGLVSAAFCAVALLLGSSMLSYFPKPIVGGLNMYVGLSFLTKWLYDGWSKFSKADYAIVLLILGVIGSVGFLEGVAVGLITATILFVINYSQVNVVRHTMSGSTYKSNVERPRLYHQLIRTKGHWLHILELQGYIFFGLSNKLLEEVRGQIDAPELSARYILIDFRLVTGLDSSAAMSFAKMKQLAKTKNVFFVFTNLSSEIRKKLDEAVFQGGENTIWRIFPDLDRGVAWCEDQMIETFESVGLAAQPKTLLKQLEESLPERISVHSLMKYFEDIEVDEGYQLIRQGDSPKGLFFIEAGQVTVWLELPDGEKVRIRTAREGTVIGELGMYLDTDATASVVVDEPSVIFCLYGETMRTMEMEDPEVASAFLRFVAELLAERVVDNTRTLETFR